MLYDAVHDHVWVGSTGGQLKVLRGKGRRVRAALATHTSCVVALSFDDNGSSVWSAAVNGHLTAWDAATLMPLRNIVLNPDAHLGQALTDVAPCGPLLWCSLGERVLGVWRNAPDVVCCTLAPGGDDCEKDNTARGACPTLLDVVHSLCEGASGQLWCASYLSRTVQVWDALGSGSEPADGEAEWNAGEGAAYSELELVNSIGPSGIQEAPNSSLAPQASSPIAGSISPPDSLLSPASPPSSPAPSSDVLSLPVPEARTHPTPRRLAFWHVDCQGINALCRVGGEQVWAGGTDGAVYAWDAHLLAPLMRIELHADLVRCLAAVHVAGDSGAGRVLASGSASGDGNVVLYPLERLLAQQGSPGTRFRDRIGFLRLAARAGGVGAAWAGGHMPWIVPAAQPDRAQAMDVDRLGAAALAHCARWDALAAHWPSKPTRELVHLCRFGVPPTLRVRVWRLIATARTQQMRRFKGEGYFGRMLDYKRDRATPEEPQHAQQIEVGSRPGSWC